MNSDENVDHSAKGNCLPLDLARQESLIDADGCFIYADDKTLMLMKMRTYIYICFRLLFEKSFHMCDEKCNSDCLYWNKKTTLWLVVLIR